MAPETGPGASWLVSHRRTAVILLLVLLGFGLRPYRLDHQSLWVHEATRAHLTTLSPGQIGLERAANLLVGIYDWQTGERLPAYDCAGDRWPDDAIPLTRLSLESSPSSNWASTSRPKEKGKPVSPCCRDHIRASVTEATVH